MNFDVELTEIADGTEGYIDGDQSRPAVFLPVKGQQATATQAGFDDICRWSGVVRR
jgi:hypothetical protein